MRIINRKFKNLINKKIYKYYKINIDHKKLITNKNK